MKQNGKRRARLNLRRPLAFLTAAATLVTVFIAANGSEADIKTNFGIAMLRWELADFSVYDIAAALPENENIEGESTVISDEAEEDKTVETADDNGVTARTLLPASASGYSVWKDVYVYNSTNYDIDLDTLMSGEIKAKLSDTAPQVLIIHTHGSEAYTQPADNPYEKSGEWRTTDTEYNVVSVGDAVADAMENCGVSVLHDRTLYDYPEYDGSYDRALAAINAYLEKYPSIGFILDIHRDAVSDDEGNVYKVVSDVDGKRAAQISIIVGSDGGGSEHKDWRENLKLAVALQQNLCGKYPTLMRPIYLRNSRYNQHTSPGAVLVEFGAAGNSLDEALYSAKLFGSAAAEVFAGGGKK